MAEKIMINKITEPATANLFLKNFSQNKRSIVSGFGGRPSFNLISTGGVPILGCANCASAPSNIQYADQRSHIKYPLLNFQPPQALRK